MGRRVTLALNRALKALPLKPEDAAAVELARVYARQLDLAEGAVPNLGRGFREALETLGMTPRARAALTKTEPPQTAPSALDELRERRERRST